MKINTSNQYDVPGGADPIATYEQHCIEDANCALNIYREMGNDVTLLKDARDGDILEREILVKPQPQNIPAALRTLVGDDGFDCIQTTRYDFSSHSGSAQIQMTGSYLSSRLQNKATFKVQCKDAAAPRTVSYDSETEVSVNVFMIGSRIERSITDQMKERSPILRGHTLAWLEKQLCVDEDSQNETSDSQETNV
jgi:hypothetical protein